MRSTWDYHRRPDEFLAWAERAATATRLHNPPGIVRWNAHKAYLLELAAAGFPVTPTALLRRGSPLRLRDVVTALEWDEIVVKPAVSGSSYATIRARSDDLDAAEEHLAGLLAREDVLVRRYLPSVETHGERALVAIEGEVTNAVRKTPRLAGDDEAVEPVAIEAAERALADALLRRLPPLLYARVDLAPGPDGDPCLMELELIEPSLFGAHDARALERFADAIAGLVV